MAANIKPIFVQTPRSGLVKLSTSATDVDGASSTLLFQPGTDGSRIHSISATPTDDLSADVVVRFFIKKVTTYYILAEKEVPAYTAAANVAALTTSFLEYSDMPFLDSSERFLTLGSDEHLYIALLAVPTNAIHFTVMGGDY